MKKLTAASLTGALATATVLLVAAPADAASCMQFKRVQYDTPGSDTPVSNAKLNEEYVTVRNTCSDRTIKMANWQLRDAHGHVYVFPATNVSPGVSVVVHTGSGTNDPRNRYWGSGWYVWNNTSDRARLWNGTALVDECTWDDDDGGSKDC